MSGKVVKREEECGVVQRCKQSTRHAGILFTSKRKSEGLSLSATPAYFASNA